MTGKDYMKKALYIILILVLGLTLIGCKPKGPSKPPIEEMKFFDEVTFELPASNSDDDLFDDEEVAIEIITDFVKMFMNIDYRTFSGDELRFFSKYITRTKILDGDGLKSYLETIEYIGRLLSGQITNIQRHREYKGIINNTLEIDIIINYEIIYVTDEFLEGLDDRQIGENSSELKVWIVQDETFGWIVTDWNSFQGFRMRQR